MALAKTQVEILDLKNFGTNAHILNEYAKEKEEEEEEKKKKKKTTDYPTFHRILLKKGSELLFSNSLTRLIIVSGFSIARGFFIRLVLQSERSIRTDHSCI